MKNSIKFLFSLFVTASIVLFVSSATAQIITTCTGTGVGGWSGDGGPATAAQIFGPNALVSDKSGNIYISDAHNDRIRMISTTGIISLVAGNGTTGFMGDGGPANAARLNNPGSVAFDTAGNIYISDQFNHVIRKINKSGIISTFAGTPSTSGYSGDGGAATAASFNRPYGLAFDSYNNLYVADQYNHVIRKVNIITGIITTFTGTGTSGYSGDGGLATAAKINYPNYVAIDTADNVYIADNGNHRIRVVNTSNIITTRAGTGVMGYAGDGGTATAAQLSWPAGLRADTFGNLYFCHLGGVIRKIDAAGIISTYAGGAISGYSGDGGPATAAALDQPHDVALDPFGNVFVADYNNNRIRKISGPSISLIINGINAHNNVLKVYPIPNNGAFSVSLLSDNSAQAYVTITNIIGQKVKELAITTNNEIEIKLDQPAGIYILSAVSNDRKYVQRITIE